MQEKQERHSDQLKRKVVPPEGVPRLFDLIKVKDNRLKLAFYELMRNTVVAKDLEQVLQDLLLVIYASFYKPTFASKH